MDNLNTPDNMSKNTHTKLFKSQFSGASGNKKRKARKALYIKGFGTFRKPRDTKMILYPAFPHNFIQEKTPLE